jgi:hypothetical protein
MSGHWRYLLVPVSVTGDGFPPKAVDPRDAYPPALDWPARPRVTRHNLCAEVLAQDGQIDEARTALDRLKELQPEISVAWIEQNAPWTAGPMPKYVEGMRKAGLQ